VQTACRETVEELGLPAEAIDPWITLPRYQTVSGFEVQPVLAAIDAQARFVPDRVEVAQVFEVPLGFLMDPAHHQQRQLIYEGETIRFFAMSYEGAFIWGATAAMIRNLYHFLRALQEQS
jgi:8-oxo-dGTP pyrophosphatase MutT (NUDIX family)